MEKQVTHQRQPIPVPLRVAIGLQCLATGDSFESLCLEFGMGVSTCHSISKEIEQILEGMVTHFIKFPSDEMSWQSIMGKFEGRFHIPQ